MDAYIYDNRINQLKSFFRKPLTLIVGIMFSLSAIAIISAVIYNFLNSYSFKSGNIDSTALTTLFGGLFGGLLNILPAIAFFIFYFKSKKPSTDNFFFAPSNILTVYSIISIFIYIALSAVLILCLCFMIFLPFVIFVTIFVVAIIAVALSLITIYFCSMMLAARSVAKSCKTLYIKKWQMIFFGVMSTIISAVSVIIIGLILNNALSSFISGGLIPDDILSQLLFWALILSVFLTNLFLAIWSFSYVRFANRTNAGIKYYNSVYCQVSFNSNGSN